LGKIAACIPSPVGYAEQTLQEFRQHRRFEKPSATKRRRQKAARFAAMLMARHAED
jgi:ribosomal protein S21